MPTSVVTVSQYTAEPPVQIDETSTFEVRGWYTRDFIGGDAVTPVYGNDTSGEQGPYYNVTCHLNVSGNLIVPAHDIQATTLSNPTANYFEGLWVDGAFVQMLMPNNNVSSGWQIPTIYGSIIAIDEIALYNRAKRLLFPPDTYPTFDEVVLLIQRLAGNFDYAAVGVNGITSMSVPPALASLPIAVGDNDARVNNITVNANSYVTGGAGTSGSPYTGWDTEIPWADNITVEFQANKVYGFSSTLTLTYSDVLIIGNGATWKFTGSGDAVLWNGHNIVNGARNIVVNDLLISGNASATNGLHLREVNNSTFRNVRVTDVSNAGFLCEFCVLVEFDRPVVSTNDAPFTTTPKYGMYLDWNPATMGNTKTTSMTILNPVMEGIRTSPGVGIYADNTDQIIIIAGSLEACTIGYQGTSNSQYTRMIGSFLENPTGTGGTADIVDAGFNSIYEGVFAANLLHITAGGNIQVIGGYYHDITLDNGTTSNLLMGTAIAGTLTDNGTATWQFAYNAAGFFSSGKIPQKLGVGAVATQFGQLHVRGEIVTDAAHDYNALTLDHSGNFASGAETWLNFTQQTLPLSRIANFFAGGGKYGLKFYTATGSALRSDAALALDGDNNASFSGTVTTAAFQSFSGPGGLLTINGSGVIGPTNQIHHVAGAGPLKTITVPTGFTTGAIYLIPDATWSYDLTGNIGLAGTAVIGRVVIFTYDGTHWWPSY